MSCPGLHCPGCTCGSCRIGYVVAIPIALAAWIILTNIVLVLLVMLGAFVLAAVIVSALVGRQDARELAACSEIRSRWAVEASQRAALPRNDSRAVGGVRDVHLHFHGVDQHQAAEVIRRAVEG